MTTPKERLYKTLLDVKKAHDDVMRNLALVEQGQRQLVAYVINAQLAFERLSQDAKRPSPMKPEGLSSNAAKRFWPKVQKGVEPESCWIWTGATTKRDGIGLFFDGRIQSAHRVSYMLAYPSRIPYLVDQVVKQKCKNSCCVRPDHLKAVRRTAGKKLTPADVAAMREKRLNGQKLATLAKEFGVSIGYASRVCTGDAWKTSESPATVGDSRQPPLYGP